jgi:hypothetical protein
MLHAFLGGAPLEATLSDCKGKPFFVLCAKMSAK